jgi:LPS sulfotransferase NodH
VQISSRVVFRQWLWARRAEWLLMGQKVRQAKPIFIISFPRTGSSLLMERIASYDGVGDCGEVLNQRAGRGLNHRKIGRDAVVGHIHRALVMCRSNFGAVKIHFNHLDKRRVSLAELLASFPDALYVFLYRTNILEQYCSQLLASRTRRFHSAVRSQIDILNIDLAEWSQYRNRVLATYKEALQQFMNADFGRAGDWVVISYEELCKGEDVTLHRVMRDFGLECNGAPRAQRLRKQEKRNLSDIIQDYARIQEKIDATHLEITQADGSVQLR